MDFGLAQEVSQIKTSAMHGNLARINRARIEAANQILTPPTVETPHHPANKTVKRKLVVSPGVSLFASLYYYIGYVYFILF